jgi:hypothetical protein
LPRGFTVQLDGWRRLDRKLRRTDPLLGEPMRKAFTDLGQTGVRMARPRAPVATGRLKSRIKFSVPRRPFPKSVTIRANVTRKRARYGYILDAGVAKRAGRKVRLHYRGSGRPTAKWFTGIRGFLIRKAGPALQKAKREVERNWQR